MRLLLFKTQIEIVIKVNKRNQLWSPTSILDNFHFQHSGLFADQKCEYDSANKLTWITQSPSTGIEFR